MANADSSGTRVKDLAQAIGRGQPATHQALQDLIAEGFAEQAAGGRRFGLALDLFVLAARAGQATGLRELARSALLRLSAAFSPVEAIPQKMLSNGN